MTIIPKLGDLKSKLCADWDEITEVFNSFPNPQLASDIFGDVSERMWMFRGHQRFECLLVPSVERAASKKYVSWAALESMILAEFRAKAPMHMDARNLPPSTERLAWLALMQHYGVPTRLLDFTFSPYIALYFALRNFVGPREQPVHVLAIDATALRNVAQNISIEADKKEREAEEPPLVSLNPESFTTDRDAWQHDHEYSDKMISDAIAPSPIQRSYFNERGFVATASPNLQNPRLSSQQGLFLVNGAEGHSLYESLFKMMNGSTGEWYRLFAVPIKVLPPIERKLFQMNIHDLSLFPDMEGVAGFVRQKARLHWDPDDPSDPEQL
jgi:hypothetical protein